MDNKDFIWNYDQSGKTIAIIMLLNMAIEKHITISDNTTHNIHKSNHGSFTSIISTSR
jgi:hypothetical protein